MLSTCDCQKQKSGQTDHVVALLKAHVELSKRLIYDIETDYLGLEALKHRIKEIEKHLKTLQDVA